VARPVAAGEICSRVYFQNCPQPGIPDARAGSQRTVNPLPWSATRVVRRWSVFCLLSGLGCAFAGASERQAILEAIHHLENPRNLTRPGPRGELGAYQFREETWRMHTSLPFSRAVERACADQVAVLHFEWLRRGLERARLPASAYFVALAWNSGLNAVVRGRAPRSAHRYAERAANLAAALDAERRVAAR